MKTRTLSLSLSLSLSHTHTHTHTHTRLSFPPPCSPAFLSPPAGRAAEEFEVTPVQAAIILKFSSSDVPTDAQGPASSVQSGGLLPATSARAGATSTGAGSQENLGPETGAGDGEGKPQWGASELAGDLGMSVSALRRRIAYWVNASVIIETVTMTSAGTAEPLYTTIDRADLLSDGKKNGDEGKEENEEDGLEGGGGEDEEEGGIVASAESQRKQEAAVHESFIMGMLTTFDSLPIERIHNMLKMFVSDPPYDRTLQQLHVFLSKLVAEEKLELKDGAYKKRK